MTRETTDSGNPTFTRAVVPLNLKGLTPRLSTPLSAPTPGAATPTRRWGTTPEGGRAMAAGRTTADRRTAGPGRGGKSSRAGLGPRRRRTSAALRRMKTTAGIPDCSGPRGPTGTPVLGHLRAGGHPDRAGRPTKSSPRRQLPPPPPPHPPPPLPPPSRHRPSTDPTGRQASAHEGGGARHEDLESRAAAAAEAGSDDREDLLHVIRLTGRVFIVHFPISLTSPLFHPLLNPIYSQVTSMYGQTEEIRIIGKTQKCKWLILILSEIKFRLIELVLN